MPKKVLIALPPLMLKEVDAIALAEHRSRSDLIREALRRYIEGFKRKGILTTFENDGVREIVQ
jgi:metal-responsive CopG/Arc/MetJ family transcriptional regulator